MDVSAMASTPAIAAAAMMRHLPPRTDFSSNKPYAAPIAATWSTVSGCPARISSDSATVSRATDPRPGA